MTIRRRNWFLLGVLVACAACFAAAAPAPNNDLPTVAYVDLHRYLGRWYEIARYPNRFEKDGDRDITATYSLRPDGRIAVLNASAHANGKPETASGWAKVDDAKSNAKLRVTFFWPFFGNYWILELGQNYEYAVVGEPARKYLWILSRTPQMNEATYRGIVQRLYSAGYDSSRLIRVQQTSH
ncbi:MAG: lipocalin family protein [Acidobacteriota bacterium]|nr:lipocalin family protein [Acidobacteriota bacterium]